MSLPAVAGIAACILFLIFLAVRYAARRAQALEQLASEHGWSYARTDSFALAKKLEDVFPDARYYVKNVMVVSSGGPGLFLFDFTASSRRNSRNQTLGSGCLIESSQLRGVSSRVDILTRSWSSEKLITDVYDFGDTDFARAYLVRGDDAASAARVLRPEVQRVLLAHAKTSIQDAVRIGIGPGRAVVLKGSIAKADAWVDAAALMREIDAAVQ